MSDSSAGLPRGIVYQAVMSLAQTCETELAHTQHVTALALRLFDATLNLHHLGNREREWLEYASLLHDIGWVEGWKEHHKTSLRIILSTSLLPFDGKERLVIGSIARYHRKAEPSAKHDHFTVLEPDERRSVIVLSAILRLADGLDRQHKSRVKDISCRVGPKTVRLTCLAVEKPEEEFQAAAEKGTLFEQVFNRRLKIDWNPHL